MFVLNYKLGIYLENKYVINVLFSDKLKLDKTRQLSKQIFS